MNESENINMVENESEDELSVEQETHEENESLEPSELEKNRQEPEPESVPQKPVIMVKCTGDGMGASIELSRVATKTLNPESEDIYSALSERGVVFGIDEKFISHICENPVFNEPIEVAKGISEKTGQDGYLKYLIETERNMRPKERADGTMDYYDLGFIQNVTKGQRLCEVYEAQKGDDGMNIFGIALEGRFGRTPDIPIGKNTEFDKENSVVVASSDGNAVVTPKGIIDVYDVIRIPANVDNSTGNIFFSGDVIIGKDVASGFKIITKGNIVVKGTVEGATLNAKGDITIGQGINGMNTAKIVAGGTLRCKHIQNCNLAVTGDVYSDSIMFSSLECSGSVELSGKRGGIIGGKTVIAKALTAKTLGNDKHVPTQITMAAVGLQHNEKIMELKKQISDYDKELETIVQTLNWCEDLMNNGKLKPFQANAYENAKARQVFILQERPGIVKELENTQSQLLYASHSDSFIKCTGSVHTGVRIIFGTQILNVQSSFVNSRIYFADGEIFTSPL